MFHVILSLKCLVSKLEGIAEYVTCMFDDISVREDLVFNKTTGELVGFVSQGKD